MEVMENENLELTLLLEAIHQKYGYDFKNYSRASLKRRIHKRLEILDMRHISELLHGVIYHKEIFESLLLDLSINVTEMFRDPTLFKALREQVLPCLEALPFIRIWHAGCATGEEVYSMAILLKEAGLLARSRIYATDFNEVVLKKAKAGIYPISRVKAYTANYQKAGGTESFADYYTARYESVVMEQSLKETIVFSDHNLATDSVFGEMDLVICRNVLIYFNRTLQNRALKLFHDSLGARGFLCLGSKESLAFSNHADVFVRVDNKEKIYRKKTDREMEGVR